LKGSAGRFNAAKALLSAAGSFFFLHASANTSNIQNVTAAKVMRVVDWGIWLVNGIDRLLQRT
jgi:hypothetical protein